MRKNKFKILAFICATIIVAILIACNRDDVIDFSETSDKPFALCLGFSAEDAFSVESSVDTKAKYGEEIIENEIRNIWLLLFDEGGNRIDPDPSTELYNEKGEIRQGLAYTIDEDGAKTPTDEIYGSTYISSYASNDTIYINKERATDIRYIRAVANTNNAYNPNFHIDSLRCETIDEYNTIGFRLTDNLYREKDMWVEEVVNGDTLCFLRMAGNWEGVIPEGGLDFNIGVLAKPMAAKVSVEYQCIDQQNVPEGEYQANVSVTSVQLARVPQNCYYKDVENPLAHDHSEYTSYHPRLVYSEGGLNAKDGNTEFYVPQNMRGEAGIKSPDVTEEELATLSSASIKSLHPAQDATCVIITATYNYWDVDNWTLVEQPIYIELYPGENDYDYNVTLRHQYHIVCTITADATTVKWDTDYRVTLDEVLPTGPIVHYEFSPTNLDNNSAYDADGNLLGGYPRYNADGSYDSYKVYADSKRTNYTGAVLNDYESFKIDALDGDLDLYYHQYIYGYAGTNNVISDDSKPFLRNLAEARPEYNNFDNHGKTHPEIFDCTHIRDNRGRYTSYDYVTNNFEDTGELAYYVGTNSINCSLLELSTGWGSGLFPTETDFTIVFIGSVGTNLAMGEDRGVYYGNSIEYNKRWYFYRVDGQDGVSNAVTYGFGKDQLQAITALVAEPYQNVQSYDICNSATDTRKVYYNNVDVKALDTPISVPEYKSSGDVFQNQRPSTTNFQFDGPMHVFGHTTYINKDDAIDAKLRLFLVYDRVLTLDDIDQIRRYASLKGLLLYGEGDYGEFDTNVSVEVDDAVDSDGWTHINGGGATFD